MRSRAGSEASRSQGERAMGFNRVRQTQAGEQEPVCTHCKGKDLRKRGWKHDRRIYYCVACRRTSYGLPPDLRPRCFVCKGAVIERKRPDGRSRYQCRSCGKQFMSEYERARRERGKQLRYRHPFTLVLDRRARAGLGEYVQATGCTDVQAVRAIFRYVLTGAVFGTVTTGRQVRSGRPTTVPVPRDPAAAAMRFPDLRSERAKKHLAASGGHFGRGFLATVMGVQRITVWLDDEAKEGLVYTMRRLELNHADAARWLLTNVKMPDAKTPEYLRLHPEPFTVATGGKRPRYEWEKGYDPGWDD
ncbi:MAG: hypothetical protein H8F28_21640 [Fibrella sp.]|nr:hypothetical protein [Armatimonadota bacterium]